MSAIKVANASQLNTALHRVHAGDTIELAGGNYGRLELKGVHFSGEVTITSASDSKPAVFAYMHATNVSNVTFDGVDFVTSAASGDGGKPFVVNQSDDITIRNAIFDGQTANGYGQAHGIWVVRSDHFTLETIDAARLQRRLLLRRPVRSGGAEQHAQQHRLGRDDRRRRASSAVRGQRHRPARQKGHQAHRRHPVLEHRRQQPDQRPRGPRQPHRDPRHREPRNLHRQWPRRHARQRGGVPQRPDRGQYRDQRPGQRHRGRRDPRVDHPATTRSCRTPPSATARSDAPR